MRCKTVQKRLDRLVRRELAPQVQAAIETHLEQCEVCRQCLAREKNLMAVLQTFSESPTLPEGFEDRVIEAARQRQGKYAVVGSASGLSSSKRPWHREKRWRALVPFGTRTVQATVLSAGVLLGILMGQQTWQSVHPSHGATSNQNDSNTAYHIDYLSDAPDGSLAESFLMLTASSSPRER